MTIIDIEVQKSAQSRLPLFIEEAAKAIEEGYGAGNCTPNSEAFWSLYPKRDLAPDFFLLRIELDNTTLSDHEIAAAVRKVGQSPSGDIEAFGHRVGRWTTFEEFPSTQGGAS